MRHWITGYSGRRFLDRLARGAAALSLAIATAPLVLVLWYVTAKGIGGIDWEFFTRLPKPVGEKGGGMGNAVVGTLELVGLAALFGIPSGILAGVYLSEHGEGWFGRVVRFAADVMSGIPSITVGLFIYSLVVMRAKHFSAVAGALALAILMLPTVTRTTEELLRLVPESLREAALGLGVPRYRATLFIVLRTALPGIMTGVMLALARVAGETAPLLFTAFGNRFWASTLNEPTASLPVQIYVYAVSPYEDWHRQAWAAAFVLVAMVMALNLMARVVIHCKGRFS